MRILLVHRYFWPDTPPYASMLLAIARKLVNDGHQVEVISSQPSYKSVDMLSKESSEEIIDGVKIKRISLFQENRRNIIFRLINFFYFPLRVFFYICFNKKIDVVMSSTSPPVVTGFSCAIAAKIINSKFVYHCMDLHPEIGFISGEFSNPFIYKMLLKLDLISCNLASIVVILSKDMQESLLRRPGIKQDNFKIINNFSLSILESVKQKIPSKFKKKENTFRILFAGNIGRFQMLESFIDAMDLLKNFHDIELVFLGEGAALNSLKKRADGNKRIKFFPHQKLNIARQIISESDLGIVSLLNDVYKYAFPSKTMAYLSEGCPLLVAIESKSELFRFVVTNKIGFSVLPNNPNLIANSIIYAKTSPKLMEKISQNCMKVSEQQFSESFGLNEISHLFQELTIKQNVNKL